MLKEIIFRYGIGFNGWYNNKPKKVIQKKRKVSIYLSISEFIIDETLLKVGENYVCGYDGLQLIEPIDKIVLGIGTFSFDRRSMYMLVAEQFIQKLCKE